MPKTRGYTLTPEDLEFIERERKKNVPFREISRRIGKVSHSQVFYAHRKQRRFAPKTEG